MTETTTPAGNDPANAMGENNNTTTTTNNGKPTKNKKKKQRRINKKKNKGKGNRKPTGPPFEGLSKEDAFKGVVIKCRSL